MIQKPKLENWSLRYVPDPYLPPELCKMVLYGEVYNHPRFKDGEKIITSMIEKITAIGTIITYSGTEYEIGKPEEEYERQFPDARNRLLKRIGGLN